MPTLFEDWQRMIAPKWLRAGFGDTWLLAFGQQKDRIEQYMRDFILSRFPDFAAVDSLRLILADRSLEPPFGDDVYANLVTWRAKAKSAFQRWKFGGTHYGVLRELRSSLVGPIAGLGGGNVLHPAAELFIYDQIDALVNSQSDDGTTDLTGFAQFAQLGLVPSLSFDVFTRWNTFAVLVLIADTHAWHGGIPLDSSTQAEQARRIVQRWRAGHAECRAIVVQDEGDVGWDVLWGINDGTGTGNGPVWGSFTWGQTGGVGATTAYWTPPVQ